MILNALAIVKLKQEAKNVRDRENMAKARASVKMMIVSTVLTGLQKLALCVYLFMTYLDNFINPSSVLNDSISLEELRFYYFMEYAIWVTAFVKNMFFVTYGVNFYVMVIVVGTFRRAVLRHVLCKLGRRVAPKNFYQNKIV